MSEENRTSAPSKVITEPAESNSSRETVRKNNSSEVILPSTKEKKVKKPKNHPLGKAAKKSFLSRSSPLFLPLPSQTKKQTKIKKSKTKELPESLKKSLKKKIAESPIEKSSPEARVEQNSPNGRSNEITDEIGAQQPNVELLKPKRCVQLKDGVQVRSVPSILKRGKLKTTQTFCCPKCNYVFSFEQHSEAVPVTMPNPQPWLLYPNIVPWHFFHQYGFQQPPFGMNQVRRYSGFVEPYSDTETRAAPLNYIGPTGLMSQQAGVPMGQQIALPMGPVLRSPMLPEMTMIQLQRFEDQQPSGQTGRGLYQPPTTSGQQQPQN